MNKAKELAGYLVLLTPPGTQQKIPFYLGENIIGRSDSKADVVVRDFSISQKHARLFVTPQAMTLTDIGSKNGVTINSEGNQLEKYKEVTIDESMVIILAEVKCKFVRERAKEQVNNKVAVEVKGAKDRKTTDIRNFLSQDEQEGKKQSNLQKNRKQGSKIEIVKDQFDIDEGFSKLASKQQKYKSVNLPKKIVQNLAVEKVGGREQKQNKVKNQKAVPVQKNDKQVIKKEGKNKSKSTIQNKQEKQSLKEVRKVEKLQQTNQQKVPQKQVKFSKVDKLQNKKDLSVDKLDKDDNQKKIKRKAKQPKNKEASKDQQEDKKSESAVKAIKNKSVTDKSKSVAAQSREKSENKSDATDIQVSLGASTKRLIRNRKRLPTEAALKEAGVLPQRRSYLHKKILISGFTPPLTKKYFQVMESLDDQFDFLVMREYKRTVKALYSICKGIPIVKYDWLRESEMFNRTLSYQNYYFKDHPKLYESIETAKDGNRVLSGYVFYLGSDEFHLKIEDIEILIVAAGGQLMKKVGKLTEKERKNPNIVAIIRNLQEKNKDEFGAELNKAKKFGFEKVYTVEMILDSIEKQEIVWQKNKATI